MSYDIPLRVAVGGSVNSSKSSLLGVLKTNKLDNGNGSARSNIFNYPHEKKTGRTSSIAQRTMKIENKKIIFFDLAGHEKYFRTTLFGISSSYPNIMLILVESNRGILKMTKEHILSAIYLRIPIVFIMTKIDIAIPSKLKNNVRKIKKLMKRTGKKVYEIHDEKDVKKANISCSCIPLFKISLVKGNDIDPPLSYLTTFLDKMNINKEIIDEKNKNILFVIDKSFRVDGYPLIGSGYMKDGKISVNSTLFLGPINNDYIQISIRSIHDDDRNNISFIRKNESGCIAFKTKSLKNKKFIKPGMIITNKKIPLIKKFVGLVNIFSNHSSTIKVGYNTLIHCGAVKRSTVVYKITDYDNKSLNCIRGGDKKCKVYFEFIDGKQFVNVNDRFIFREGRTRGSGQIIEIIN